MIDVRQLQFAYPEGRFRLDIPALGIASGTATAVIGPSGSGKTTLLNLLAGILSPERGTVTVHGRLLTELTDAERREFRLKYVGQVFQDFRLLDYLSVVDNVLLPCRLSRAVRPTAALKQRAVQLLTDVGLGEHAHRSVTRLSQGERQRVGMCRALVLRPPVLLADEPTGNLDPETALQTIQLLREQAEQQHATLVVVTHDHSLLSRFSRVIDFRSFLTATSDPDRGRSGTSESAGAAR